MSSNLDTTKASEVHQGHAVEEGAEVPTSKNDNVNVTTEQDSTDTPTKDDTSAPTNNDADRSGRSLTPPHPDPESAATETKTRTQYPHNDARGMSPRRSPEEIEQMVGDLRARLRGQALDLQASLQEIIDSVELARFNNERLERQNLALQDYIGGLTRSLSTNDLGGRGKGKK